MKDLHVTPSESHNQKPCQPTLPTIQAQLLSIPNL